MKLFIITSLLILGAQVFAADETNSINSKSAAAKDFYSLGLSADIQVSRIVFPAFADRVWFKLNIAAKENTNERTFAVLVIHDSDINSITDEQVYNRLYDRVLAGILKAVKIEKDGSIYSIAYKTNSNNLITIRCAVISETDQKIKRACNVSEFKQLIKDNGMRLTKKMPINL